MDSKVRQKITPRQMKVTGACIGNWVGESWLVIVARNVTVVALVNPEQAQEMGRRLLRRAAPLSLPEERVEVVGLAQDRTLPHVERLADGLQMEEPPRQLQVRVCDVAVRILWRHEAIYDVLRPLQPPYHWRVFVAFARHEVGSREPDSSRALARRIVVPLGRREQRDEFADSCRALADVVQHPAEVIERVMHPLLQRNPRLELRLEGMLHVAEHVPRFQEGQ